MNSERRKHFRVALSYRSAIFFFDGFISNVEVVDFSASGIKLDTHGVDYPVSFRMGVLKLYVQLNTFPEVQPYVLAIPSRIVWADHHFAGIEFLNPDDETKKTIDNLLAVIHPTGGDHA
ncbi:MAG: PilZ domain-containing protein [Magnetococcales bacterium]|nr:PilZ domain-containing protein [Magnetococcales bacterium]